MRVAWTKSWSSTDNTTIPSGQDLQMFQKDVSRVVDGGITDTNVSTGAAVAESKFSFDTTNGHRHDGTDADAVATAVKMYRRGCGVYWVGVDTVGITAGAIDAGGTILSIATTTFLNPSDTTDWVNGSETAGGTIFVYAYNNSGTLAFRFSDEAPDLLDQSDNVPGIHPFYQKYGTTYYRCIGSIQNISSDLVEGSAVNYDLTSFAVGMFRGDGADRTQVTMHEPSYIMTLYGDADATPANDETVNQFEIPVSYGSEFSLNFRHDGGVHDQIGITTAGTVNSIGITSIVDRFIVDGTTTDFYLFWGAWSSEMTVE